MWIINFLFSWALLIFGLLMNIGLFFNKDGDDERLLVWQGLFSAVINITLLYFTYHALSSGHGYFDRTSCYLYGSMLLFNSILFYTKDRTSLRMAIPVLLPFIIVSGGGLIFIGLKIISFISKIAG